MTTEERLQQTRPTTLTYPPGRQSIVVRLLIALPPIIAAILLFVALANWPYRYYEVLRWAITAIAIYVVREKYRRKAFRMAVAFVVIVIVFNPIEPTRLDRETWAVVDLLAGGLFLVAAYRLIIEGWGKARVSEGERLRGRDTMTIPEAQHILDIVCVALQDKNMPPRVRITDFSVSDMAQYQRAVADRRRNLQKYWRDCWGGYNLHQISIAANLQVASEFLYFSISDPPSIFTPEVIAESENKFREGLKVYGGVVGSCFAFFGMMDIETDNLQDEIPSSFGQFCKSVGAKDQLYWQKIYTRLGLQYTSTSPRANIPVQPFSSSDDSCNDEIV